MESEEPESGVTVELQVDIMVKMNKRVDTERSKCR